MKKYFYKITFSFRVVVRPPRLVSYACLYTTNIKTEDVFIVDRYNSSSQYFDKVTPSKVDLTTSSLEALRSILQRQRSHFTARSWT